MSREFFWEYIIPNGTEEIQDAYFMTCPIPGFSHYYCRGGSGNSSTNTWTIWVLANKSKARRVATGLDSHFGAPGFLRRLELW